MSNDNALVQFKALWENLNPNGKRELWHFITAMRGPDNNENEDLKYHTTAYLRSFLIEATDNFHVGAIVNYTGEFNTSLLKKDHFGWHIKAAFSALKTSGLTRNKTIDSVIP